MQLLRALVFLFLVSMLVCIGLLGLNCSQKDRSNPLDPDNPATHGDPFELTLTMKPSGVRLDWESPPLSAVAGFRIYRSREAESGFEKIADIAKNEHTYIDAAAILAVTYFYRIAAIDPQGRESQRSRVRSVLTEEIPLFGAPISYSLSISFGGLSPADIDKDGDVDLIALGGGGVNIVNNDGHAGFSTSRTYENDSISGRPYTADLDGDADDEIICGKVIFWNRGGTFDSTTYFRERNLFPTDLDSDGDYDLVGSLYREMGDPEVGLYENSGQATGIFLGHWRWAFYTDVHHNELVAADMDGDGDNDIVTWMSSYDSYNSLQILLNVGNWELSRGDAYYLPSWPTTVSVRDLNRDALPDLSVAVRSDREDYMGNGKRFQVFRNSGSGQFSSPDVYQDASWRYDGTSFNREIILTDITAFDADGNGSLDLAIAVGWLNVISIWKNAGDGTFQLLGNFATGPWPGYICSADFDGDGDNDLATIGWMWDNGLSILLNNSR
ncbi:MAG TPA: VCBS repeat-containing protein [Candidatus Deferrimicrobium sp.]|nr:VCBS repeat-containing protein [Candidatus Deferrimicrobium sp.]